MTRPSVAKRHFAILDFYGSEETEPAHAQQLFVEFSAIPQSGNVGSGERSDGEFVDRHLRVLHPAICRRCLNVEAKRADMQPLGGTFRKDDSLCIPLFARQWSPSDGLPPLN